MPGLFGYEAGQSALGDIFALVRRARRAARVHDEARGAGVDVHEVLAEAAARCGRASSGLLALDWWNGNRSVLVDADLRGLLVGMTLATTRAGDLPRADRGDGVRDARDRRGFERRGSPVDAIVACGGLPERNPLLMQIFADVTRPRDRGRALDAGAGARRGDVGRGRRRRRRSRLDRRGRRARWRTPSGERYVPRRSTATSTTRSTREYLRLHDLFGRGGDDVMRTLNALRQA